MFRSKLIKTYEETLFSEASLKEGWQEELKARIDGNQQQIEIIEELDRAFADDRFTKEERESFAQDHWPIGERRFANYENFAWSNWAATYYNDHASTLDAQTKDALVSKILAFQPDNLDANFAPVLGAWTAHENPNYREQAANILGKMGPKAQAALPDLILAEILRPQEECFETAIASIGISQEHEADILLGLLAVQPNPDTKLEIAGRLAGVSPQSFNDDVADILESACRSSNHETTRKALTIVGAFGTNAKESLLFDVLELQCLGVPAEFDHEGVIKAMGASPDEQISELHVVFEHRASNTAPTSARVALNALTSIARLDATQLREGEELYAADHLKQFPEQASRILSSRGSAAREHAQKIFAANMLNPGKIDMEATCAAIGVVRQDEIAFLTAVLSDPRQINDHVEAAIRIAELGSDGFALANTNDSDILKAALGYEGHSQRLCGLLGEQGEKAADYLPTLYRLSLQYAGLPHFQAALDRIGITTQQEVALLDEILRNESSSPVIQENACIRLAQLGQSASLAVPTLTRLLATDAAQNAAIALGSIGLQTARITVPLARAFLESRLDQDVFLWTLQKTGSDKKEVGNILSRHLATKTDDDFIASLGILSGLGEFDTASRDRVTSIFVGKASAGERLELYGDLCRIGQTAVAALKKGVTTKISYLSGNPSQVGSASEKTAAVFLELNYHAAYLGIAVVADSDPFAFTPDLSLNTTLRRLPSEPRRYVPPASTSDLFGDLPFDMNGLSFDGMDGIGGLIGANGTQIGSGGLGARGSGLGGGGTAEGLGGLGTKGRGSGASGYGSGGGNFGSKGDSYGSYGPPAKEPEFTLKAPQSYAAHKSDFTRIQRARGWTCDAQQTLAVQALLILATTDTDHSSEGMIRQLAATDANGPVVKEAARYAAEYVVSDAETKYRRVYKATGTSTPPPIILGGLDQSLIDAVIKRNMAQIRYCYQRELVKNPGLSGEIVVKFVIAKDGTVSSAVIESTTMHNEAVESAICGRFMGFQFPEPKGGGIVVTTYPFNFYPG